MKVSFTELAWSDYLWLQKKDKRLLKRVNLLIKDVIRDAFEGIGKPEPLKGNLSGYWSRRIDGEHRLVYQVVGDEILIISCRFHYER
jgi:toxin YoeB